MKIVGVIILIALFIAGSAGTTAAQSRHPSLFITTADVEAMREALGKYPLFDKSYGEAKKRVEKALTNPMDVPVPKDAGGYTHERHKQNYLDMHAAGILYAVTKEERYASFVRAMLLRYATLYPTLDHHPAAAGESAGRLFWQTLNETVWLVHATQAYDCVYDVLDADTRTTIEGGILRPMARFLSEEHAMEMDRIHNHGTWTCTAVGMAGYVLNDQDLVDKALYGSKKNGAGGFIRQLEMLFSPDGFYTEGAYYVRYALLPFFTFAQVIENNQPGLKIFAFRDRILEKALHSALQMTYTNGGFLPINDALKDMTFVSPEMVAALDIVFSRSTDASSLLSIAKKQDAVLLNSAGVAVARALTLQLVPAGFPYKSVEYTDGPQGNEGGVGLLRSDPTDDHSMIFMKYGGHGLSHGHYDKLSILYYDHGREVLQDYGSARFVNIEQKYGGRYLPENKSFAMQTIAHNTVTVDEQSHYQGKIAISEKHHADRHFFSVSDPSLQVMSATVSEASPGVQMQRTVAMVKDAAFAFPIILDIFKVNSSHSHSYDLPFYYQGHVISTNVKYTPSVAGQLPLGRSNGYQHLWNEAEGRAAGPVQFSWINGGRYYTITSAADSTTQVYYARIGAADPNFNLRHDPAVILRQNAAAHVFATISEPHGRWDGVREVSENARPTIQDIRVLVTNDNETAVEITGKNSLRWIFLLSHSPSSPTQHHQLTVHGRMYEWVGNARLLREVH